MIGHRFAAAAVCSLALVSLVVPGSAAHAQSLSYCRADAARLCPGTRPGGGRLAQCLKAHQDQVSIGCAKELKGMKSRMGR